MISRRRSERSTITPPNGANVVHGKNCAAVTPVISTGDDVNVVANNGSAVSRKPSPRFETKVAVSSAEKVGPRPSDRRSIVRYRVGRLVTRTIFAARRARCCSVDDDLRGTVSTMTATIDAFDRVRVMFPDHLGLARGKYLPTHLAPNGTGHCATLYGLGYDRSMIPAPGSYLLEGLIDVHATMDPATLRGGWEDDTTAVAVADLSMHGESYPYAARTVLKEAIGAWNTLGYQVQVGIELEAYLLEPDGNDGWKRFENPRALVYGTGIGNDPTGIIDAIMRKATECSFRPESINAEFDESQYELTLEYGDALETADNIFLFRVMAREIALAHGFDLTFLGKPFAELSGSGVHFNVSFVDADGNNALADETADDGLSALAKQAIAGLCAHHKAMAAIAAPTVNAYRRLQPAQLSGYWANWGYDHRCVATRVPPARGAGTRIESRVADGAVNIHLGLAAVLTAARLGVANELDCPPAETGDGFEEINTDICVAADLNEALDDLTADTAFAAALGQDVVDNFIANKRAEWERFVEAEGTFEGEAPPTAWELNEYLPYH